MTAWQISAAALVGAICLSVLRKRDGELALLLGIAACAVLLLGVADLFREVLLLLRRLAELAEVENDLLSPVLKTGGIALLTTLTAQTCRDAGAGSLATAAELCGTLCCLYAALPLVEAVLGLLSELM